jgi:hypothetical protein
MIPQTIGSSNLQGKKGMKIRCTRNDQQQKSVEKQWIQGHTYVEIWFDTMSWMRLGKTDA